ncbi:MAG: NAD-dependent aldehyde dehydrogenase [Leptolyngbya sp.]|nr:MAG: NAD-dependent aldehyde dehydrogenase [Leptolyngbya sp.]
MTVAEPWAIAANIAKGIDPQSSLAGEDWLTGPVAILLMLQGLIKTLEAGGQLKPPAIASRPNGQLVAQVFPDNWMDRLMWLGFKGEVWIQPDQPATQGKIYRQNLQPNLQQGVVSLVLGAGNVSAIAALDSLHKLFAENQVVLLKMNPVNAYVGEFLEKALQPLIQAGFLAIVYGDAELGRYLCQHPQIETIHITGSHHTHDAIVWGSTLEEQQQRKAAQNPALTKPITSELGCVTPILIVPGNWSAGDIAFQARQVASMVAHNASFNCVAAKVVITASGWQQRDEFLHQLHQALAASPSRKAYYPGAQDRYQAFLAYYPQAIALGISTEDSIPWTVIPNVPPHADEYALQTEAFCGVLAEVTLEAADAKDFLAKAIPFINESVWGNLSCVLLIDPKTQRRDQTELDEAISQLHYGAIGINVWTGMMFMLAGATWGAFPGNPLDNIRSGRGIVHNAYLFDHPQKTVLYAPFRIFPTPTWFADHKNLRQVAMRYANLIAKPSLDKFLSVVLAALTG